MTVRSSTRGLPGLPRGRCGLSAFQASSDSQNKLFAMTIALQRLKSSANISSKSTSCMGSLPSAQLREAILVAFADVNGSKSRDRSPWGRRGARCLSRGFPVR